MAGGLDAGLDAFSAAILGALVEAPDPEQVSLSRLTKQLGIGASGLMRQLASMGSAPIGGVAGPGWVRVTPMQGRWVVALTDSGRALVLSEHRPKRE